MVTPWKRVYLAITLAVFAVFGIVAATHSQDFRAVSTATVERDFPFLKELVKGRYENAKLAEDLSCRLLMLRLARGHLSTNVYLALGAQPGTVASLEKALRTLYESACGSTSNLKDAIAGAELARAEFALLTDEIAKRLSLQPIEVPTVIADVLRAELEGFRGFCGITPETEIEALLGRIPGLDNSEMTQNQSLLGSCTSGKSPRSILDGLTDSDRNALGACIQTFLTQAAEDCSSPVAQDHPPQDEPYEVKDRRGPLDEENHTKWGDSGWKEREGGGYERTSLWEDEHGNFYQRHETVYETEDHGAYYETTVTLYDSHGHITDQFVERHSEDGALDHTGRIPRLTVAEGLENIKTVSEALQSIPDYFYSFLPGPIGRQCRAFNSKTGQPFGIAVERTAPVPDLRPKLGGSNDVFAYCLCTSAGDVGKQLANSMGYGCGRDERALCLLNPKGPDDGIRRECAKYVHETYGTPIIERIGLMCEAVVDCPPNALAMTAVDPLGLLRCSCRDPSGLFVTGRVPGNPECQAVECPAPGSAMSGRQSQCCVLPSPEAQSISPASWVHMGTPLPDANRLFPP